MKIYAIITILLWLHAISSEAQFFSTLHYNVEFGSALSVGPVTFKEYRSMINPWSVSYYNHQRYRFPSLRFRGIAAKPLNDFVQLGLQTGAEAHYVEPDGEGGEETFFSFPLQATTIIKCLRLNKKWAVFSSVAAGVNINNWHRSDMYRKTGFLGTFDICLAATHHKNAAYYKIGFEYAREIVDFEFIPFDPSIPSLKYEKISVASYRRLVFVSIGHSF